MFSHVKDLDFADDLAKVSGKHHPLTKKTNKQNILEKKTGLNISTKKTIIITINAPAEPVILSAESKDGEYDVTNL